jgi:hypothetical protein
MVNMKLRHVSKDTIDLERSLLADSNSWEPCHEWVPRAITRDKVPILSYYVQWTQALCRLGAMDINGSHGEVTKKVTSFPYPSTWQQPPWEALKNWSHKVIGGCGATV